MPIQEHPPAGSILLCDFSAGFTEPEMVKTRPVIVMSPKIVVREGLRTVIPLSTVEPKHLMPYHFKLEIKPDLPGRWAGGPNWVKGDMIVSVGFHRLDFIRLGKDRSGKRIYRYDVLPHDDMKRVRTCVLRALGMSILTKHL